MKSAWLSGCDPVTQLSKQHSYMSKCSSLSSNPMAGSAREWAMVELRMLYFSAAHYHLLQPQRSVAEICSIKVQSLLNWLVAQLPCLTTKICALASHNHSDLLSQLFKLWLQRMGPACLYRSTSRKTFPLSTREIMTCLCNTFLKTFFRTQVMSPRLLCWLSKQRLFFPDYTICNMKSTFPNSISPIQDLETISGKYTNERLFSREQPSRNHLMVFIFVSLMHI